MWKSSLITVVLGVSLLVVLAVVLALVAEIIRQIVLDKQDKPMQRSVDELTKRRGNNDTTRVG